MPRAQIAGQSSGSPFASVLLGLLMAAGAAAGLVALLVTPGLLDGLRALPQNPWWRRYRDPGADAMAPALWRIGAAAAAALVSLVAVLRLRARYDREPSPVLPFVMVFFFALGLECLRAGTALLFAMDESCRGVGPAHAGDLRGTVRGDAGAALRGPVLHGPHVQEVLCPRRRGGPGRLRNGGLHPGGSHRFSCSSSRGSWAMSRACGSSPSRSRP